MCLCAIKTLWRDGEVTRQVTAFVAKTENPSSISGIYMVEDKQLPKRYPLNPISPPCHMCAHLHKINDFKLFLHL